MDQTPKLSDPPIRDALRQHIDENFMGTRHRVKNEMVVSRGYGRIDLAAITEKELHGYEIKSDVDSFARLERQIECYGRMFDRLTLVTTEKKIGKGLQKIPEWWGILLALPEEGAVEILVARLPGVNPYDDARYIESLAGLLWVDELIHANDFLGIKKSGTRNHYYLRKTLIEGTTVEQLRSIVCATLLKRNKFDWKKERT